MTNRYIPEPTGSVVDTISVRNVMTPRHRETQPQLNQALLDTVPGEGSGDQ